MSTTKTNTIFIPADTLDEADIIHEGPPDKHRWFNGIERVTEHNGKFYQHYYMEPASEMQDGQDRYSEDPVECIEVERKTKTVEVEEWVPVEEGGIQ